MKPHGWRQQRLAKKRATQSPLQVTRAQYEAIAKMPRHQARKLMERAHMLQRAGMSQVESTRLAFRHVGERDPEQREGR